VKHWHRCQQPKHARYVAGLQQRPLAAWQGMQCANIMLLWTSPSCHAVVEAEARTHKCHCQCPHWAHALACRRCSVYAHHAAVLGVSGVE
jgi:hypothetical protein